MAQDKIVQVVALDQDTYTPLGSYFTLASPSGELTQTLEQADTTIFGAGSFQTQLPTIASFTGSFASWLRNIAGYNATIQRAGTPTPTTAEPMSLVSGETYQVTDTTKQLMDYTSAIVIYNGVDVVSEDEYTLDPLFGRVTFDVAPVGDVTADYDFRPLEAFGRSNSVSLTQSADTVDTTTFRSAERDNGYSQYEYSLLSVEGTLDGFYDAADNFYEILNSRDELILEVNWDGSGGVVSRMSVSLSEEGLSGDVGQPEESSISFVLSSRAEDFTPYSFMFSDTTQAGDAFQLVMNSWINREYIGFRYAPNGLDAVYYEGSAAVSDASLENSVTEIPELSVELQGTRELVRIDPA